MNSLLLHFFITITLYSSVQLLVGRIVRNSSLQVASNSRILDTWLRTISKLNTGEPIVCSCMWYRHSRLKFVYFHSATF